MRKELGKLYEPKEVEDKIYQYWLENDCFKATADPDKKPYTIVIPPPNITGQLHMGHALDNTLQDILIRYKRMSGYATLWLPGTDHASIATEAKIVEAMRKEGISKDDIGREGFLKRAWDWKDKYGSRIISQLKKMGSSCDWSRERFTLDEGCSKAVKEVFCKYYEKGLIYRGERIINWCPHCKTSISNAEVNYEEQDGHFWHIRYPLVGGGGYVEVATTRPETLLGDTAVAVNPNDERYKDLIGQYCVLPLVGRRIPIVADEHAQLDKGTGCVKITPAHDPNDFEVGKRCHLPMEVVLTEDAKITAAYPKYAGMDRYEARKAIVEDLRAGGFLAEIEDLKHEVGTCYRCGTTIEPMLSLQWFVKMEPLAKAAIDVVRSGDIKFVPERFDKNYFHWMENTQDWCISRQLWWGHRIPAFYCDDCGETVVTKEDKAYCPKCGKEMRQDSDTLDTWFSSALWPFSTLGWPEKTNDLDYFYPTSTLVTGYDIITFWVSRMIVAGMEHMHEKPFDTVLIHGLVRDSQGRKMSKSLGNGIDPLEVIDQYGADALRFMLASGNSPGNDMRYSDEKVKASRNFANKLWNATRFIMMNLPEDFEVTGELPEHLELEDKWLVSKLNKLAKEVNENLEKFELGVAVSKLYDFIWDVYCDWYIELTKPRINAGGKTAESAQTILVWAIIRILKLLHPFMPFITEEIWQALKGGTPLMLERFPVYENELDYPDEEADFEKIIAAIKSVRNRRAEMNVPPSKKAELFIETDEVETFKKGIMFFERLAYASKVEISNEDPQIADAVACVTDAARLFIPLSEIIDKDKELARLNKEKAAVEKDITIISGKLNNPGFLAKAPAQLVESEKAKLAKAKEKLAKIEQSIAML
jgi:valyl-tRNA synthetase